LVVKNGCSKDGNLSTAELGFDAISVVSYNILVRSQQLCATQPTRSGCLNLFRVRPPDHFFVVTASPVVFCSRGAAPLLAPHPPNQSKPPHNTPQSTTPQADRFAWNLSSYCPPEYLGWDYRWPRITAALARLDADVVCLQEVDSLK